MLNKTHLFFVLILLGAIVSLHSTNYYVSPSGAGSGDGSSWTHAAKFENLPWGSMPAGQTNTVYVAGGTYGFDWVVGRGGSAGFPLRIRRATGAECGSVGGWSSAYDTTVNLANCGIVISGSGIPNNGYDYIEIDGVVPNGIRIEKAAGGSGPCVNLTDGSNRYPSDHIALIRVKFDSSADRTAIENIVGSGYDVSTDIEIAYCTFQGPNEMITLGHCENVIIRNNVIYQMNTCGINFINNCQNIEIYGNVFYQCCGIEYTGTAVIDNGNALTNLFIYNNTFGSFEKALNFTGTVIGGYVRNNLYYNNTNAPVYGACMQSHNMTAAAGAFIDAAAHDYHLADGIAGLPLGPPYDMDMDGVTRGSDGTWDIGAFEYVPPNQPPSAPVLLSPGNSSTVGEGEITFRWEESTDPEGHALTYKLYIDTNSDFSGCTAIEISYIRHTDELLCIGLGLLIALGACFKERKRLKRYVLALGIIVFVLVSVMCSLSDSPPGNPSNDVEYDQNLGQGTYYWKVEAEDSEGAQAESDVWQFDVE